MSSLDRRAFLPFAGQYFLRLREPGLTSDDVHAFMNETLGMGVPLDARNAVAFDLWRKAMQKQGYRDAWGVSEARAEAVKTRAAELMAEEKSRQESGHITLSDGSRVTLANLAKEAPDVPAGELLRQAEKRQKARDR